MPATDPRELASRVYALSGRAFELARAVASGDPPPDVADEARQVRIELMDLNDAIDALADPTLRSARSEAVVDLNYVMSGGAAPLSLRLAQVGPRPDDRRPEEDLED
ncbi:MAG: hypothetical protein WEE50_05295 [Chloroflexota bacterium]